MVVTKYFTNNKGEIDKVVNEFLREEKISHMDLIFIQYQAVGVSDCIFLVYEKKKNSRLKFIDFRRRL